MTKHIILTGVPGIGKTTIVRKISEKLVETGIPVSGFYTQELRNNENYRIGFDIITFDGKTEKLSRIINYVEKNDMTQYNVGNYIVFPTKFENIIIPILDKVEKGVLILDEIGKMELFSRKFESMVRQLFQKPENITILATIPIRKGKPIKTVEDIRKNQHCEIIEVTRNTRNTLSSQLFDNIIEKLK